MRVSPDLVRRVVSMLVLGSWGAIWGGKPLRFGRQDMAVGLLAMIMMMMMTMMEVHKYQEHNTLDS